VDEIIGIDLSPRMIERARATGLYAEVDVAEIVEGLARRPDGCADLILAADVMVYMHDMTALLREVARVLAAGGLFAFTVESHAGEGVVLGEGLRYAYSESCVRALVAAAGLVLDQLESASSRTERCSGARPDRGRSQGLIRRATRFSQTGAVLRRKTASPLLPDMLECQINAFTREKQER
jgi:predicted TPR repeat methyltransferase